MNPYLVSSRQVSANTFECISDRSTTNHHESPSPCRSDDLVLRSAVDERTQTAITRSQIMRRNHGWNPPNASPVLKGAYATYPTGELEPRSVNQPPRTQRAKPRPMTTTMACERLSERSCMVRFFHMVGEMSDSPFFNIGRPTSTISDRRIVQWISGQSGIVNFTRR